MNSIQGDPSSGDTRIWPFKIMMVIQTLVALLFPVIWAFASFGLFTKSVWKLFVPRFHGLVQVIHQDVQPAE